MPVMDPMADDADPELAAIPVVIISGAADVQDGTDALAPARVLTKPVRWPVLLESVERSLRRA